MSQMTKRLMTLGAAAIAMTVGSAAQAGTHVRMLDAERAVVTDFTGKPPFQRKVVKVKDLSATEFARFEELRTAAAVDRSRVGKRVLVTDFSGKPPFNRKWVTVTEENATEFARFEEEKTSPAKRRLGPPASGFPNR